MERVKMELTINYSKIVSVHARSVQQAKQKMDSSMKRKGLIE
ncbi:MAG: hypothetical protein ACC612_03470 [Methanomethylovorans sp.]